MLGLLRVRDRAWEAMSREAHEMVDGSVYVCADGTGNGARAALSVRLPAERSGLTPGLSVTLERRPFTTGRLFGGCPFPESTLGSPGANLVRSGCADLQILHWSDRPTPGRTRVQATTETVRTILVRRGLSSALAGAQTIGPSPRRSAKGRTATAQGSIRPRFETLGKWREPLGRNGPVLMGSAVPCSTFI